MNVAKIIRYGTYLMIAINLLMAFGAIGVFLRMAPAIEKILGRNERSLQACENMNRMFALSYANKKNNILQAQFAQYLRQAQDNITETGEHEALQKIQRNYESAFQGNQQDLILTLDALQELADSNREAMARAARNSKRLCMAGAWSIVFMSFAIFLIGIFFRQSILRNVLSPIENLGDVLDDFKNGNRQRRCLLNGQPRDIRNVLQKVNNLLDEKM